MLVGGRGPKLEALGPCTAGSRVLRIMVFVWMFFSVSESGSCTMQPGQVPFAGSFGPPVAQEKSQLSGGIWEGKYAEVFAEVFCGSVL